MLVAYECWIIKSTRRSGEVLYAESHKQWNKSIAFATIFRDYDAAWQALEAFNKLIPSLPDEEFDVVPLYGALITSKGRLASR